MWYGVEKQNLVFIYYAITERGIIPGLIFNTDPSLPRHPKAVDTAAFHSSRPPQMEIAPCLIKVQVQVETSGVLNLPRHVDYTFNTSPHVLRVRQWWSVAIQLHLSKNWGCPSLLRYRIIREEFRCCCNSWQMVFTN